MSEIGKHKMTEALHTDATAAGHDKAHVPGHDVAVDQAREAQESEKAKEAEASIRDRMVDIGRGNQQAGRQGQ